MVFSGTHVVIIGGGFSGAMQAVNLLRHDGPRATIIEREGHRLGRGVAYSAAHPSHLLNVAADNMSALPDDPGHFRRWLDARPNGRDITFAPRDLYGSYLAELLADANARGGDRVCVVEGCAQGLTLGADHVTVRLADGRAVQGDAAILALGNLPPHSPPEIDADALPSELYAMDPWASDIAAGLSDKDTVLLLGTGLTSIDAALLLDAVGFSGSILALSRRGLIPRPHDPTLPRPPAALSRPPKTVTALLRHVRARAELSGWRAAVDELRPHTQAVWRAAAEAERSRFLRHLRPYWDVHRHRLAPAVAERIDTMQREGRLRFAAGKIVSLRPNGARAVLQWRQRSRERIDEIEVRRVVNCTGPQGDLLRTREEILIDLLSAGAIRADALRLGIDVDTSSRVIDAHGCAHDRLFAIGPMTRGSFWEIVAVPDLRQQTWTLARRLANAHWVEGEGL